MSVRAAIGSTALVAALSASALACRPSAMVATAGFWFERGPLTLMPDSARRLGGPLTPRELAAIEAISLAEVRRAFAGLNVHVTDDPHAFWRVEGLQSLRAGRLLPNVGESMPLGMLGGSGSVAFDLVASKAVQYAAKGASRQSIIEGIGRGIGRVAAHEFAHQILNAGAVHNDADENSYEFPSPDRASQYYGDLHWSTARPLLEAKLK